MADNTLINNVWNYSLYKFIELQINLIDGINN